MFGVIPLNCLAVNSLQFYLLDNQIAQYSGSGQQL